MVAYVNGVSINTVARQVLMMQVTAFVCCHFAASHRPRVSIRFLSQETLFLRVDHCKSVKKQSAVLLLALGVALHAAQEPSARIPD